MHSCQPSVDPLGRRIACARGGSHGCLPSLGTRMAAVSMRLLRRLWERCCPARERLPERRQCGRWRQAEALDFEVMRFHPDRPPDLDIRSGLREIVGVVKDVRDGSARHTAPQVEPTSERSDTRQSIAISFQLSAISVRPQCSGKTTAPPQRQANPGGRAQLRVPCAASRTRSFQLSATSISCQRSAPGAAYGGTS